MPGGYDPDCRRCMDWEKANIYGEYADIYELLNRLSERSGGLFQMKEGTLYPILYRLEDEKFIESVWSGKPGRSVPKKMYTATHAGHQELQRRKQIWSHFEMSVDGFLKEEMQ